MNARDSFLAAAAVVVEPVPLRNGHIVYVRELTVGDMSMDRAPVAEDGAVDDSEKTRLARAAAAYLCDEAGSQLFDPSNPQDVAAISQLSWPCLRKVLKAGDVLNGGEAEKND